MIRTSNPISKQTPTTRSRIQNRIHGRPISPLRTPARKPPKPIKTEMLHQPQPKTRPKKHPLRPVKTRLPGKMQATRNKIRVKKLVNPTRVSRPRKKSKRKPLNQKTRQKQRKLRKPRNPRRNSKTRSKRATRNPRMPQNRRTLSSNQTTTKTTRPKSPRRPATKKLPVLRQIQLERLMPTNNPELPFRTRGIPVTRIRLTHPRHSNRRRLPTRIVLRRRDV